MLSRNLSAKAVLGRGISQRYRNGVSRTSNDNEEKRRLIQNFDTKKVNDLLKRQKFAPEERGITWILTDGVWTDSYFWMDSEKWEDSE